MNRRALILEELQLSPLWVRRELLQAVEEHATDVSTQPANCETVLGEEAHARHPLPAVARAANKALAPLITPAEILRAHRPVAEVHEPVVLVQSDARAQAIAQMDWPALQEAVANCTACTLCASRKQTVFGVGNPQAQLLVVGEAPGEEEDRLGEPFVGRAGKLLDNMLKAIGEKRGERVYIANVLKCRPPANRNPQAEEVALCAPFLKRQIELIAPKAILASGRFAAHCLLASDAPLSALRGKTMQWQGTPLVVTYHPAYLLRNLSDKSKSWDDLLRLRHILDVSSHINTDKSV